MKNRKKFFAFLLIFVMIVTCISPQQINAKTTLDTSNNCCGVYVRYYLHYRQQSADRKSVV